MIDTATLRARLDARIAKAAGLKIVRHTADVGGCEHSWGVFRKTVIPDSDRFKGTGAHFIVKGCTRCHSKRAVHYVVER